MNGRFLTCFFYFENMAYLLASIVSSSFIYVVFRIAKNYQSNLSALITYNYLAATLLGLTLFHPLQNNSLKNLSNWVIFAVLLGILFILMFFLIGISSQKAGITVTTLANKLSLVFPVLFSLLYFNEQLSTLKIIGLVGAFTAIVFTVYKNDVGKTRLLFIVLPILIFFGSGLVDSIVKYVQAIKISDTETSLYTTLVFFVAFMIGLIVTFLKKNRNFQFRLPTLFLGFMLGAANFGSLYFIIKALNNSATKSSLIFALNNMSVVALTAITGTLVFKEKLNKINFAGILLAIISLYFLL